MRTIKITKELANHRYGGDLWNESRIARLVLKDFPNALRLTYHIGSGLYINGDLTLKNGDMVKIKVLDGIGKARLCLD